MLLSVIVPCYNESDVIEKTWTRLTTVISENGKKEKYDYDIDIVQVETLVDAIKYLEEN